MLSLLYTSLLFNNNSGYNSLKQTYKKTHADNEKVWRAPRKRHSHSVSLLTRLLRKARTKEHCDTARAWQRPRENNKSSRIG